jgi:hypothetical protein
MILTIKMIKIYHLIQIANGMTIAPLVQLNLSNYMVSSFIKFLKSNEYQLKVIKSIKSMRMSKKLGMFLKNLEKFGKNLGKFGK